MTNIFVDGSYSSKNPNIASWSFIVVENDNIKAKFNGKIETNTAQVAGELTAVMKAIEYCLKNGIKDVTINYDYQGIEAWVTGSWKAKKPITKQYVNFIKEKSKFVNIRFNKIKAHSGNKYNELTDKYAKEIIMG
jgi:ribonuclease HI